MQPRKNSEPSKKARVNCRTRTSTSTPKYLYKELPYPNDFTSLGTFSDDLNIKVPTTYIVEPDYLPLLSSDNHLSKFPTAFKSSTSRTQHHQSQHQHPSSRLHSTLSHPTTMNQSFQLSTNRQNSERKKHHKLN